MRARALAILPVVLLLLRCTPRTPGVEVLSSKDADPAVLGEQTVFPDLGVSFRPPRNWRVEAETGMKAAAVGSFTLEPERVFYRDDGMGFCLVSRLVPADGLADADPLKTYVNDLVGTFKNGDNVSYKNLRINRLPLQPDRPVHNIVRGLELLIPGHLLRCLVLLRLEHHKMLEKVQHMTRLQPKQPFHRHL